MKSQFSKSILILIGVLSTSVAQAELDFFAELGLHFGGDKLVTVDFTDDSSSDIRAGELLSLGAGIAWDINESLEARFYVGWLGDEISATNGDVNLNRATTNLMLFYKAGAWRYGGGAAYHWNVKLGGSGDASDASADFDDALGAVAEVDYFFTENIYVGMQYLNMEYDSQANTTYPAKSFDASSIGVTIGGRW